MAGIEALLRGKVLVGRYRVDEVIGRGGMGVVYRAIDERLGRAVAVKVITAAYHEDSELCEHIRARFRHEGAAAARLPHHSNVVPVYDFGTDPEIGIDFIIMELMRGEDLAERLRRAGPPPLGLALRILRDAARGVAVGHRVGLIHRDVKPGNIFLVEDDDPADVQVRVLDFGIAKLFAGENTHTALTHVGLAPLSPAFASPEQLRGEPRLTPAADVYGLGIVAFHLLTGTAPFTDGDRSRLAAGTNVPLPSIKAHNSAVPPDVEAIVRRALAHDPTERYANASLLANAIEAVLHRLSDEVTRALPAIGPAVNIDAGDGIALPAYARAGDAGVDCTMPVPPRPWEAPGPAAGRSVSVVASAPVEGPAPVSPVAERPPSRSRTQRQIPRRTILGGIGFGVLLLGLLFVNQGSTPRRVDRALAAYESRQYSVAYPLFARAADDDNAVAQAYLGHLYEEGKGVGRNDREALRWYQAAAEQGNAAGQSGLGFLYSVGRGVVQDDAEALHWTRLAAAQGDARGQNNLGVFYDAGRIVKQDYPQAVDLYRKAAQQGFAPAQANLGSMYASGRGITRNDSTAVWWYRQAAAQGYAQAQTSLGRMYAHGRAVPLNHATAREWYLKAAEQGDAGAQTELGYVYLEGIGVQRDYGVAREWYLKAAGQGDAAAQNTLGYMHVKGLGVPRDYGVAREWYLKAAGQGNAVAQSNLGDLYMNGLGVPRDYGAAREWYLKAAEQGDANAQAELGYLYLEGLGVQRDYSAAREWSLKAAGQGSAMAQNNLGYMYSTAKGVPRDDAEAERWFRMAAGQGNTVAQTNLRLLQGSRMP